MTTIGSSEATAVTTADTMPATIAAGSAARRAAGGAPYRLGVRPYLRRRLVLLGLTALLAAALIVALGRVGAQAGLEDPVAGHVVVAPGETLWDVAVATAPDGVDPRRQVRELRALNGIDGAHLDAWAVILIPAR